MWTALCSLDNLQFDHNKRQVKSCIFCTQKANQAIQREKHPVPTVEETGGVVYSYIHVLPD